MKHLSIVQTSLKTANNWVKFAPFGRWDAQKARAPYPRRHCDTKSHDLLLNSSQRAARFNHGMVLPVPEPGGRFWQRRGLKNSVRDRR